MSTAGGNPRRCRTCAARVESPIKAPNAQEKLLVNRKFYPVAVGVGGWVGNGGANGIVRVGQGWRGLGLFLWAGLRVGNAAVMARGCDVGGFYLLGDVYLTRTRKRITAHSVALPFLGARIARAALTRASAVVERARIAAPAGALFTIARMRIICMRIIRARTIGTRIIRMRTMRAERAARDDGWGDHPIGGPHSKYPPKRTGHVLT